jgi:hypothetical protein
LLLHRREEIVCYGLLPPPHVAEHDSIINVVSGDAALGVIEQLADICPGHASGAGMRSEVVAQPVPGPAMHRALAALHAQRVLIELLQMPGGAFAVGGEQPLLALAVLAKPNNGVSPCCKHRHVAATRVG